MERGRIKMQSFFRANLPSRISVLLAGLLLLLLAGNCYKKGGFGNQSFNPLDRLVYSHRVAYGADSSAYQLQVLFSPVRRDTSGKPVIEATFSFGLSDSYFYPASTVKMPVSALALQRLGELGLSPDTPISHQAGRVPQTAAQTDTTTQSGLPTVGQYIRKVFLTSDNDAYNRLYEWLGPSYINTEMRKRGLDSSRIIHRLGIAGFDTLGNRWLNPISFGSPDSTVLSLPERYDFFYDSLAVRNQVRGYGYLDSEQDSIVYEPFDFRFKNYFHIRDMHHTIGRLIIPEAYAPEERFDLSDEDYRLLWRAMAQRPRESKSPIYTEADNWAKFWMYGDRDSSFQIPRNIRILNKIGLAYGYLTDAAYIVDLQTGLEFLLTASIHVNANGIYNDGQYKYEEIGLPFFSDLGQQVYQYEQDRRSRIELPKDDALIRLLRSL
ncbi:MAG: serine hydrolase [Bacteroidota bacterium]